jgi:hypothetical protein
MTPKAQVCEWSIYWWDIDIDETCRRPAGHRGHHTDGLWWFDDNGIRVPIDPAVDGAS